jgi:hypothetical protein
VASQYKSHPAGSLSSSQPEGPPCWVISLAFGLILVAIAGPPTRPAPPHPGQIFYKNMNSLELGSPKVKPEKYTKETFSQTKIKLFAIIFLLEN